VVGELEKISPAGTRRKPSIRQLPDWVSVFKDLSVPDGTIDECWQSLRRMRDSKPNVSIVPYGTDVSFCIISQSGSCRILGYFH
jgi:hypothetical protein